jgi:hypothetical protein
MQLKSRNKTMTQALTLTDHITIPNENGGEEKRTFPLQQAFFDNCIIDGNLSPNTGEILFSSDNAYTNGDDEQFNFRFNHCVLKSKKTDQTRYQEVLFIEDVKVANTKYIKSQAENKDEKYDYIYDFRVADESMGIGKADRSIAELFPVDRFGVDRLASEYGPSIGAYEYIPQEEEKK